MSCVVSPDLFSVIYSAALNDATATISARTTYDSLYLHAENIKGITEATGKKEVTAQDMADVYIKVRLQMPTLSEQYCGQPDNCKRSRSTNPPSGALPCVSLRVRVRQWMVVLLGVFYFRFLGVCVRLVLFSCALVH